MRESEKSAPKSSKMLDLTLLCTSYLTFNFKFEFFMQFWYRGHDPSLLFSELWAYMRQIKKVIKKARKWHSHAKTL